MTIEDDTDDDRAEPHVDERLHPAIYLAATTGMRHGEILGLRWADLDLDRAVVSVRQAVVTVEFEVCVQPGEDRDLPANHRH